MQLQELLKISVSEGASDLHIIPGLPPLIRVHGDLFPIKDKPVVSAELSKTIIYSAMTIEQQESFENKLHLDMALLQPSIGIFRVSILHESNGIAAAFRIIPETIPTIDQLELPPILKRLMILPHGLILLTGPTGSGKSTTLAAMVEQINLQRSNHIITIEDPIEFIHHSKKSAISQLQVGRDTPNFASALRASLRQDPDVIMIGELRDLETIRLALTAAETGHLVLATLHASSSPLAISRIVDVFSATEKPRVRNLLSETIQAVLCQTLVKRLAGGRIGAFEIMLGTDAIRHLIRQDMISHMPSTIQTNGDIGMCTMDQYLQELVAKRLISTAVARGTTDKLGPF